ncbi:MAG: putative DNA binding domain-containing protein [Chloroflexi bacterium]|nr:putative DNA binding domain-containing protein [Chloroflexota bacterium]
MTDEEFAQILALNHELRGVEFKSPAPRNDRRLFAQVVRAVLGMSNIREGGVVVIGVGASLERLGLSDEDLATWTYDDVADGFAAYADPSVSFDLETKQHEGKSYVVIEVAEFEDIPVLCKRDYQGILRSGACYVRTRRKPETSELPTQTEMRGLLDMATDKVLGRFLKRAQQVGIISFGPARPSDEDLFNQQLGDLR